MDTDINDISEEEREFNLLFNDLFPKLCFYASKFIKNLDEAKDITIDAFSDFHKKYWKKTSLNSYKPLLYTLIKNKCLHVIKQKGRKAKHEKAYDYLQDNQTESIENKIIHTEIIASFFAEIKNLPQSQFEVIELTLKGYTVTEIAKILNRTENLVSQHKIRAIKFLKMVIKI